MQPLFKQYNDSVSGPYLCDSWKDFSQTLLKNDKILYLAHIYVILEQIHTKSWILKYYGPVVYRV